MSKPGNTPTLWPWATCVLRGYEKQAEVCHLHIRKDDRLHEYPYRLMAVLEGGHGVDGLSETLRASFMPPGGLLVSLLEKSPLEQKALIRFPC